MYIYMCQIIIRKRLSLLRICLISDSVWLPSKLPITSVTCCYTDMYGEQGGMERTLGNGSVKLNQFYETATICGKNTVSGPGRWLCRRWKDERVFKISLCGVRHCLAPLVKRLNHLFKCLMTLYLLFYIGFVVMKLIKCEEKWAYVYTHCVSVPCFDILSQIEASSYNTVPLTI